MKRTYAIVAVSLVALVLAGCSESGAQPSARQVEQAVAQQSQANLNKTSPIPVLPISQEREMLIKRAKRINVQNMSSCVTLFTNSGAVVGQFPVNGKVSSLNSYLLSGEQIVSDPNTSYDGRQSLVVEQPDIDGAYGKNAEGIFFFDAVTDAYIEWGGPYFWSDQCLTTSVQPILISQSKED